MWGKLHLNISFVTNCSFLKSNRYLCAKLHILLSGFVCFAFFTMQTIVTCYTKAPEKPHWEWGASQCWTYSKMTFLLQRKPTRSKETKDSIQKENEAQRPPKATKKRSARIKLPSSVPLHAVLPLQSQEVSQHQLSLSPTPSNKPQHPLKSGGDTGQWGKLLLHCAEQKSSL